MVKEKQKLGLIGRCLLGVGLAVGGVGCEESLETSRGLSTSENLALTSATFDYAATNPNADYTLRQRQGFAVTGNLLGNLATYEAMKEAARESRSEVVVNFYGGVIDDGKVNNKEYDNFIVYANGHKERCSILMETKDYLIYETPKGIHKTDIGELILIKY